MKLSHQTIVLTGATGGIGKEIAAELAGRGCRLVLVARHLDALQSLGESLGRDCHCVCADISTESGRQAVIEAALKRKATVLINNAGICQFDAIDNISEAQFRQAMEVNLMAPACLTRAFLNRVSLEQPRTVINVGSALGAIGFPFYSSYCTSKFALRGFSESLARELAGSDDKVLYFAPRATKTAMNSAAVDAMNAKLGNRVDEPTDVARALVRQLESGRLRSGVGLPEMLFAKINGLLPQLVDSALSKKLGSIRQFVQTSRG